ncbi:MAG TPA: two-component sensor histidine kinase, partial [Burkholderiaceae bacterium]
MHDRPNFSTLDPGLLEEGTSPAPLETEAAIRARHRTRMGLNLFWRTFFLLALLLVGSILAWLQTLRALELEP